MSSILLPFSPKHLTFLPSKERTTSELWIMGIYKCPRGSQMFLFCPFGCLSIFFSFTKVPLFQESFLSTNLLVSKLHWICNLIEVTGGDEFGNWSPSTGINIIEWKDKSSSKKHQGFQPNPLQAGCRGEEEAIKVVPIEYLVMACSIQTFSHFFFIELG